MDGDVRIDYNVLFTIQRALERAHTYATRARTDEERSLLHRMATDLANRIRQEDRNFNQSDFLTKASINPDWGKLSAAA